MSLQALDDLAANRGSVIVNDTTEYTVNEGFDAIMVLEDTQFSTLKVGGVNKLSEYVTTPLIAVKAGALITGHNGVKFSAVDLVSGSVAVIL